MSIAWSEGEVAYTESFEAVDTDAIIDQIHAHSVVCGWGSDPISGGFLFTIESKQGLFAKIKVVVNALSPQGVLIQFLSFDETHLGYQHLIPISNGGLGADRDIFYRLHTNRCQIFIAELERDTSGWAMQGGIPFMFDVYPDEETECALSIFPGGTPSLGNYVQRGFWSAGQNGDGGRSFRWSHYTNFLGSARFSALYNDDLMNSTSNSYSDRNALKIHPVKISIPDNYAFYGILQRTRHYSETHNLPLFVDPLLGWGSGASLDAVGKVRAQLYDAVQPTMDTPLDFDVTNLFGTNWWNYMHGPNGQLGSRFGSLLLAKGQPVNLEEAYIY